MKSEAHMHGSLRSLSTQCLFSILFAAACPPRGSNLRGYAMVYVSGEFSKSAHSVRSVTRARPKCMVADEYKMSNPVKGLRCAARWWLSRLLCYEANTTPHAKTPASAFFPPPFGPLACLQVHYNAPV